MYVDVPQSTGELLRLKQRVQEGQLDRNAKGQHQVGLLLEDGTRYTEPGTFQFREVSVDPTTGSVMLRVVFPNPEGTLLPGMFVRAVVQEGINDHAILIPQQSVSRDPKGNPVTLVVDEDNTVGQRMLSIDRAVGAQWLVTRGLSAGDRIIVEGVQKVRPGATVRTVPFEENRKKGAGG
jgi:membrane fusion protein (multidrug efflux system)